VILAATSAVSVAASLRRLLEDPRPLDRLLLMTDERVGLPLGAKGVEYLQDLERAGVPLQRLEMTFAEYAELDALQAVVGLARSGDLEVEPRPGQVRPVTEAEVVAAHRRLDHYLGSSVLRELLASSPSSESRSQETVEPMDAENGEPEVLVADEAVPVGDDASSEELPSLS
jgi:hypothetical protein